MTAPTLDPISNTELRQTVTALLDAPTPGVAVRDRYGVARHYIPGAIVAHLGGGLAQFRPADGSPAITVRTSEVGEW